MGAPWTAAGKRTWTGPWKSSTQSRAGDWRGYVNFFQEGNNCKEMDRNGESVFLERVKHVLYSQHT